MSGEGTQTARRREETGEVLAKIQVDSNKEPRRGNELSGGKSRGLREERERR